MTATNDGIIHLRGKIEGGKLVALLDHQGQELGGPVTSKLNEVTGVIKNPRIGGVMSLLEKKGVVANGTTDDSSAFQEFILAARSEWGGAMPISAEISAIKLNSGITLNADTDRCPTQSRRRSQAHGADRGRYCPWSAGDAGWRCRRGWCWCRGLYVGGTGRSRNDL